MSNTVHEFGTKVLHRQVFDPKQGRVVNVTDVLTGLTSTRLVGIVEPRMALAMLRHWRKRTST